MGSDPRFLSPRTRSPSVVETTTPSPRLMWATAREATSRIRFSNCWLKASACGPLSETAVGRTGSMTASMSGRVSRERSRRMS